MNGISMHFSILLILFVSINFLVNSSPLKDGAQYGFSTIPSIVRTTSMSDADSIIIPHNILDKVYSANLEKTVRDLSSFHTRHIESEVMDDVVYWLTEKLQSTCGGGDVYVHNFTQQQRQHVQKQDQQEDSLVPSYHLKNIVCEQPGSTNNTIIISAHYDSRMEDINNSTGRAPGADDNASGVSALLEIARILSKASLDHSIIFVLFSGEEQGKLGSTHYADHIDKTDVDLDLLINLDMIGFSSQGINEILIEHDNGNVVQDNDKFSQAVASFIGDVASQHTSLNTTLDVLQNTDYLPFEGLGYTVIGFHDNGVKTNPNHHKSTDTPDTLDYEYLASVTKLILATILSLDRLPEIGNLVD